MTAGRCDDGRVAYARPRLGVSACLVGQPVRFDGGHCRHDLLTSAWSRFVEWVPLCPEVEAGLGTPREPVRLVARFQGVRVETRSGIDVTAHLTAASASLLALVQHANLSGVILKKGSPSCGLARVRLYYHPSGGVSRHGRGVFAAALREFDESFPLEEEGRLFDPEIRDHFLTRVFAFHRLQVLLQSPWNTCTLIRFHAAHKLLLLAHSPECCRRLGRLVAESDRLSRAELAQRYRQGFLAALARPARRARHVNALQHAAGFFKPRGAHPRDDLHDAIDAYGRGALPRDVPLSLLNHYAHERRVQYIAGQWYLRPYPRDMFWTVGPPSFRM